MRIYGINLVAVLAASVAIFMIGAVIYGGVFSEVWGQQTLENHGIVAPGEGANLKGDALMAELQKIPGALDMGTAMGLGFMIALVTACGIGAVLKFARPASLIAALRVALILWAGFAVPTLAYNVVYSSESRTIFGIDMLHLLLDYVAAAAVIFLLDGKALSQPD